MLATSRLIFQPNAKGSKITHTMAVGVVVAAAAPVVVAALPPPITVVHMRIVAVRGMIEVIIIEAAAADRIAVAIGIVDRVHRTVGTIMGAGTKVAVVIASAIVTGNVTTVTTIAAVTKLNGIVVSETEIGTTITTTVLGAVTRQIKAMIIIRKVASEAAVEAGAIIVIHLRRTIEASENHQRNQPSSINRYLVVSEQK